MSPALLVLLGAGLQLQPGAQALLCQVGTYEAVVNRSEEFISWSVSTAYCPAYADACGDTLLFVENGPLVKLVLIKDCTSSRVQQPLVTQHRVDPSLSLLSYAHVCHEDICNDLSSTLPLWDLVPSTVPGSVQCPLCLSPRGCVSPPTMTCPVGTSHCYDGVLHLGGAFISHKLRVQGCQSQAGCNLLNGTKEIRPLSLSESCQPSAFLTCHHGTLIEQKKLLVDWTASDSEICEETQVCQETLLLIASGSKTLLIGSKGCAQPRQQLSKKTILVHTKPLGVLIASYSHFCNSSGCNDANSSEVLMGSLPQHGSPTPGDVKCPICVNISGDCPEKPEIIRCPNMSSRCYRGFIKVMDGELNSEISVQGCVDQSSISLLNVTRYIGNFLVVDGESASKAPPVPSPVWVTGLVVSAVLSSPW